MTSGIAYKPIISVYVRVYVSVNVCVCELLNEGEKLAFKSTAVLVANYSSSTSVPLPKMVIYKTTSLQQTFN